MIEAENYGSYQKTKNLRLKKILADTRKNNQILKIRLAQNVNVDSMSNQNELDQLKEKLETQKLKNELLQAELLAANQSNIDVQSKLEDSMKKNVILESEIKKKEKNIKKYEVDIENLQMQLEYERTGNNALLNTCTNVLSSGQAFKDELVICKQDLELERESRNQTILRDEKMREEIILAQNNLYLAEETNAILKNKLKICSNSG